MVAAAHAGLSDVQRDAIGYLGGAVLAVCLIPQVAKVVLTRSARDISIAWSLLYSTGLTLSLSYLILKDAPAAWIPIIFEIIGCLLVLMLKLFYEHTAAGRAYSAAKQLQHTQQQDEAAELCILHGETLSAAHAAAGGLHHRCVADKQRSSSGGISTGGGSITAALGQAAAAAVGASGDISWRGSAVLGKRQTDLETAASAPPMLDASVRGGRRASFGGSTHGGRQGGSVSHCRQVVVLQASSTPMPAGEMGTSEPARGDDAGSQQLLFKCSGTSASTSRSSGSEFAEPDALVQAAQPPAAAAAGAAAGPQHQAGQQQEAQQQQQQQPEHQQQQEGLFGRGWQLQPVAPLTQQPSSRSS